MGTQSHREALWEALLLTGLLPGATGGRATGHCQGLSGFARENGGRGKRGGWASPKATTLPIALTLHEQSVCFAPPRPAPQNYFWKGACLPWQPPCVLPNHSSISSCCLPPCPTDCQMHPTFTESPPQILWQEELLIHTHPPGPQKHFLHAMSSQKTHRANFRSILPSQVPLVLLILIQKSLSSVVDVFSLCNASALILVTKVLRLHCLARAGHKALHENMP